MPFFLRSHAVSRRDLRLTKPAGSFPYESVNVGSYALKFTRPFVRHLARIMRVRARQYRRANLSAYSATFFEFCEKFFLLKNF